MEDEKDGKEREKGQDETHLRRGRAKTAWDDEDEARKLREVSARKVSEA